MNEIQDEKLVKKYIEGDEEALEVLIKRHIRPIYGFIYRYVGNDRDAEDVTQEVFVKIWRHIKNFEQSASFERWIFSIAKNAAIDFMRKKKTVPFSEFENEDGESVIVEKLKDPALLPHAIIDRGILKETLLKAMENLSAKYRVVLFLYYQDNFNFREIAESLGESINTVKSRHRRALIMLKNILPGSSDGNL